MTAPAPRMEPLAPRYAPELQKVLDVTMPPGIPPLALFTTLARVHVRVETDRALYFNLASRTILTL